MTPKRRRFVEEYLMDLNVTKAAERAGYSAKTAYSIGQKLMNMPEVREAIDGALECRKERVLVDQEYVVERLVMEAEREDSSASARVQALSLLGKHLRMFVDRVDMRGGVTVAAVLAELSARAGGSGVFEVCGEDEVAALDGSVCDDEEVLG